MCAHDETAVESRQTDAETEAVLQAAISAAGWLPVKVLFPVISFARASGYLNESEALLEAIEQRGGDSVRLLEERARSAYARGDHETAFTLLTQRFDRAPSATAAIALARFHLDVGALDEAQRISAELLASDGQLLTVKQLAADVARTTGNVELARSYYLGLIDDRGEHAASLLALAQLSLDEDDKESAAAFFRRAVAGETMTANQLTQASTIADRIGQPDLAVEYREQAASLHTRRALALHAEIAETGGGARNLIAAGERLAPRTPSALKSPAPKREHAGALHSELGSLLPDDPRVIEILRNEFGHERLRPGQSAVIANVLKEQDTLAIMPTGIGKSLTFQLPAMLDERTTLVISPLIALMKDQVESLPERVRSRTALINSTLTPDEMRARLDQISQGTIKLVYVAPERLRNYAFLRTMRKIGVGRVVIDEAHCISMWGHDFRPDYLFIPRALAELADPPVLGITATATPDMVDQIGRGLDRDLSVVRTSVFRPNLLYEVHHLPNKEAKLDRVIQICRQERGAGIVYVSSRRDAESISGLLRNRGVYALPYHAGLDAGVRSANQDDFMDGRARVVVATVAFGMGVNKADVRFIVHLVPPRSLESYAQESGRAGRDGRPARCVMMVSPADRSQLVTNARRDELDLAGLRQVYGALMRNARGSWVVIDPAVLRAGDDDEHDPDPRIALGILEQAGLLRRHPDAPAAYDVRRVPPRPDSLLDPEIERAWESLERHLPSSWTARGAASISTAEICAAAVISPVDLDRTLQAHPGLTVREGARSTCLFLEPVTGDAASTLSEILDQARTSAMDRINQVMQYANANRCRHAALAEHLGERLADCETSCDVCTGKADHPAAKTASRSPALRLTAQNALAPLEAVKTLPFPMGKTGLVRLLLGSIESTVRADRSGQFGALSGFSKNKVETLVERLIEAGFLHRDEQHEFRLISLTQRGAGAGLDDLHEFAEVAPQRIAPSAGGDRDLDPAESRLYERLAEWRRTKSVKEALPAYVVASNSTLHNLAVSRPATKTALSSVPGIGPKSIEKYGSELLALISQVRESGDVG